MLSDAPFTSPWSSEVLITGDYNLSVVHDTDEEDELDLYNLKKRLCVEDDNRGSVYSVSGLTADSECSEELCWDGDEDAFLHEVDLCISVDPLTSNLNELIDTSDTDSPKWFDWDAVSSSSSTSSCDTSSTVSDWSPVRLNIPEASQAFTCSTISPASKMQACRGKNVSSKQWNTLSKEDKLRLVDELSLTIMQDLGMQEKLQIIKIINPSTNWNKQTEFVIDLKKLDDSKLQKIRDIVNCAHTSDHLDNKSEIASHKKFSKRSKSRDRRPRGDRQRIQKENRQKLKEKRSGLFVQEEILAVSSSNMEEEIDILG